LAFESRQKLAEGTLCDHLVLLRAYQVSSFAC
jgi:hypothetical protein